MKIIVSTNVFKLYAILAYAIFLTIFLVMLFFVPTGQLPILIATGLTLFFFFYAGRVSAGLAIKNTIPEVTHQRIAPYLKNYNEVIQHILSHAKTLEAFYYSIQVLEGSTYNFGRDVENGKLPVLPPDDYLKFHMEMVDKYLVTPAATAPSEIVTKG